MKVDQILCDECKRVKGESNHWLQIGVLRIERNGARASDALTPPQYDIQLTLGVIVEKPMPGFTVHDICGQVCFHKHIDRLMGHAVVSAAPPPLPVVVPGEDIAFNVQTKEAEYTGL